MKVYYKNMTIKLIIAILSLVISLSSLNGDNIAIASSKISKGKSIEEFKNKLDQSVPELQKHYGVAGTAIGLIEDGQVKYILNYGLENRKKNKLVNEDTVFQAASISKSLTAWGIMNLVEEGKLSLEDPVEKYLKRWHLPDSKFSKEEVTIKGLLSHTAGLTVHGYLGTSPDKKVPTIEESLSAKGFLNESLEIAIKPESEVRYSGGGYTLLQLIIEEVTGESFEEYMEKEILIPLKMNNSSFRNNLVDEDMSKAYGYFNQEIPNYNFTEKAAAGLKTTVTDFLKFMIASIEGVGSTEGTILKSETIKSIHRPVMADSALGVFVKKLPNGSELLYHSGDNRGWHAVYGLIPEKKDGIVIFTNSDNGIDLRQDVYNYWLEFKTNTLTAEYNAIERYRNINLGIAALLGAALIMYISIIIGGIKRGTRVFICKRANKFLLVLLIRLFIRFSLTGITYFILFQANTLKLQGGVKNIAIMILVWLIVLFISGLFPKNKKRGKK